MGHSLRSSLWIMLLLGWMGACTSDAGSVTAVDLSQDSVDGFLYVWDQIPLE